MSTDRPCRKTSDFRQLYRKDEENRKSVLQSMKNYFTCNKQRAIKCVSNLVPSYRIMKQYKWKTDFIQDLICGMTVGIMQLPQGNFRQHMVLWDFMHIRIHLIMHTQV